MSRQVAVSVRPAHEADGPALADINEQTWSPESQPMPREGEQTPFFDASCRPENVLVAELDGMAIGYVRVEPVRQPPTARHVQTINGLAVAPGHQGRGVAGRLVDAALATARERQARKVLLHVLSTNHPAIELYRRKGFQLEGRLRDQFRLNGAYVDDLIMALHLDPDR
jgi:ribosomal protein S18 acetylase RimI-like enzyme